MKKRQLSIVLSFIWSDRDLEHTRCEASALAITPPVLHDIHVMWDQNTLALIRSKDNYGMENKE